MINEVLQTAKVTVSQQHSGLQVFGLQWPMSPMLVYSTLDEAMSAGTLDVTEVSAEGRVPELKVESRSDVMTFLMAGEQFLGAKQNRVLNVSLMVGAHTALSVPVSCVEAGRWRPRSAKFASGGTMSHGIMRKMISRHVRESYRQTGAPSANQGEIWDEVRRKLDALASMSPSQEFDQVYKDYRTPLEDLLRELTPPAGCHGAVFAVGGKINPAVSRAHGVRAPRTSCPPAKFAGTIRSFPAYLGNPIAKDCFNRRIVRRVPAGSRRSGRRPSSRAPRDGCLRPVPEC